MIYGLVGVIEAIKTRAVVGALMISLVKAVFIVHSTFGLTAP